ncbi:MAG: KpsF/GutQ family sugar-phosphate isomerase [Candidatus Methanomethylophilus sp.]|jgi:arabinose-5-phosphate isomerase|nr:KpsF/GutQ family sugar-phosphate isomerase [Methanomethylophilus sp.]MCI2074459.1 KpsF/GutQ family sugar-phosphate isomerase [Methanomethylophilus sp.]MCI2093858.1 KpsF/GutQ family sugar-phosphate isomerase [Methanomethylophilus sp.]
MNENVLEGMKDTFDKESACLENVKESLDGSAAEFVMELHRCRGKIVFAGMGKSGHICRKIAATMQSMGIRAMFLHPAEGVHGDLGIVSDRDIVVCVSNSGETSEIMDLLPSLETIRCRIFSIVGRRGSSLESRSERTIVMQGIEEVYLDMVPTSSTTATLVLGDAIAVELGKLKGFTQEEFGIYHPKGQLGKKLTMKVGDIMVKDTDNSVILSGSTLEQAVFEMCRKPVGGVSVIDRDGKLLGIFTDGDLRRHLQKHNGMLSEEKIDSLMITKPMCLHPEELVTDAINGTISKHTVSMYPVVDSDGRIVGTLRMIDVVRSGLI